MRKYFATQLNIEGRGMLLCVVSNTLEVGDLVFDKVTEKTLTLSEADFETIKAENSFQSYLAIAGEVSPDVDWIHEGSEFEEGEFDVYDNNIHPISMCHFKNPVDGDYY